MPGDTSCGPHEGTGDFASGRAAGTVVFLFALVLRLAYLWGSADAPTFWDPIVDAGTYDALARQFLANRTFTEGFFWQPFFYPFVLSGLYAVGGASILLVKVFQAALGAATCALTYRLGRALGGRAAGLLAGLAAACYGPMIYFDGELLGTVWEAFWAVVLLLIALRLETITGAAEPPAAPVGPGADRGGSRDAAIGYWLLLAACSALSVITRPTFLPWGVAIYVWLGARALRRGATWRHAAGPALGVALAALILLPVAELSRRSTGIRSFLPYSGGLNLYVGNNPDSARTIAARPGWHWDSLKQLPLRYGVSRREETPRFFVGRGSAFAREQPAAFARGLAAKALQFVSARELPRNEDIYVQRRWSGLLGVLAWKAGGFAFPFGIVFPLAVLGLAPRGRPLPVSALLFLLLFPAAVVAVFVTARYRIPIVPLALILAARGGLAAVAWLRARRWPAVLGACAAATLAAAVAARPGPFPQEQGNYEAEMYNCLGVRKMQAGDLATGVRLLSRALEVDPAYAEAHNNLGVALIRTGRPDAALAHYREAVRLEPGNATAHANVAKVLKRLGRLSESEAEFLAALRIDPNQPAVHGQLALVYLQQGRLDEAYRHLGLALTLNPADADHHCNLGVVLRQMGRRKEALGEFQRALALRPDLEAARLNLAEMMREE